MTPMATITILTTVSSPTYLCQNLSCWYRHHSWFYLCWQECVYMWFGRDLSKIGNSKMFGIFQVSPLPHGGLGGALVLLSVRFLAQESIVIQNICAYPSIAASNISVGSGRQPNLVEEYLGFIHSLVDRLSQAVPAIEKFLSQVATSALSTDYCLPCHLLSFAFHVTC